MKISFIKCETCETNFFVTCKALTYLLTLKQVKCYEFCNRAKMISSE